MNTACRYDIISPFRSPNGRGFFGFNGRSEFVFSEGRWLKCHINSLVVNIWFTFGIFLTSPSAIIRTQIRVLIKQCNYSYVGWYVWNVMYQFLCRRSNSQRDAMRNGKILYRTWERWSPRIRTANTPTHHPQCSTTIHDHINELCSPDHYQPASKPIAWLFQPLFLPSVALNEHWKRNLWR